MFHLTGVERKPRCPAADFLKANWGDHIRFDDNGHPFSVHPTSALVDLVHQLKPKQWGKILVAAMEDSKVQLSFTATLFASSLSAFPSTSQNRLKLQLRDDDSDVCMVE
jgi:hypothetical protein